MEIDLGSKNPSKAKTFLVTCVQKCASNKGQSVSQKMCGDLAMPNLSKIPRNSWTSFVRLWVVRAVWFGSDLKFNIDGGPNLSVLKWSSDLLNRSESSKEWKSFISLIVWIGWFIWKDRNNFVFNHIVVEPLSTLIRAWATKLEFDRAACRDERQS